MAEHTIRLLGPWDWQPLSRTIVRDDGQTETVPGDIPPPRKVWIPVRSAEAELASFRGRVRWRRFFHWPSELDYWERIWVYFESADYFARIRLNESVLGEHEGALDPFTFPVTSLLRQRNCLEVELEVPEIPRSLQHAKRLLRETPACNNGPAILGEVRLEVFHPVRFGDVRVWTELGQSKAHLFAQGEILAETGSQCELYLVFDNHTLHYQRLSLSPGSNSFAVQVLCSRIYVWDFCDGGSAGLHNVQLELVDRSLLLDARYCLVGFRHCVWDDSKHAFRLNKHLLHPGNELPVVDIQSPVAEGRPFESADEVGQPVLCRLPLRGGYAINADFIERATQQASRLVRLLQHHASILGWVVHTEPQPHDETLDRTLITAVREADPSRPIFIQPEPGSLVLVAQSRELE